MALPIVLGAGAVVAAAAGVQKAAKGASRMKKTSSEMKFAKQHYEESCEKLEKIHEMTHGVMDDLGQLELEILNNFGRFSDVIEKIQNRPQFKEVDVGDAVLPEYNQEEIKRVSLGAGVLLGGLSGAALGTAGGFAASGATTAAVMALGTASTGTAIASLSGVAATNATLAALGGGALAYGGGGMALGLQILGAATLGAGLLVGGIIFDIASTKLDDKANVAIEQIKITEQKMHKVFSYLKDLRLTALSYTQSLQRVQRVYEKYLGGLASVVEEQDKTDWNLFTDEEKQMTKNLVLLVSLLFRMCQVNLVVQTKSEGEPNEINESEIEAVISQSAEVLGVVGA